VPYLSASAVVIHYKEALYQVYGVTIFYDRSAPLFLMIMIKDIQIEKKH